MFVDILKKQIYQRIVNLALLKHQTPPIAPYVLDRSCLKAVLKGAPRRISNHRFKSTFWPWQARKACKICTVSPLVIGSSDQAHWSQKQSSIITKIFFVGDQAFGKARNRSCYFLVSKGSMGRFVLLNSLFGLHWSKYLPIKNILWINFAHPSF